MKKLIIILIALVAMGCGETKSDCLYRMGDEQHDKFLRYHDKFMSCIPDIDSMCIYQDSMQMSNYAANIINDEWRRLNKIKK